MRATYKDNTRLLT